MVTDVNHFHRIVISLTKNISSYCPELLSKNIEVGFIEFNEI